MCSNGFAILKNEALLSLSLRSIDFSRVPTSLGPLVPFLVMSLPAFYNFSRSLIFEEQVQWHLKANATIRPLGRCMLSYSDIPFDKQVTLNALHSLPNVSIDSILKIFVRKKIRHRRDVQFDFTEYDRPIYRRSKSNF